MFYFPVVIKLLITLVILSRFSLILNYGSCAISGKVVNFGDKLPDYIKENPTKGWLIKFYTTWCHNCQQIELTYIEVAERIYHAHDHLIVGQVNCEKYEQTCRQFKVEGVPTIMYLKGDKQNKYNGLRDVDSIVNFAERMNGPDVNTLYDCASISSEVRRRGLMIVYSNPSMPETISSGNIYRTYMTVASHMKEEFWFYRILNKTCERYSDIEPREAIFIEKRNLNKPVNFKPKNVLNDDALGSMIEDWIVQESFPVFGPLTNRIMNSTRLIAVAVLDEYKLARKFDPLSKKFYKIFELIAISQAQINDQIVFTWSSDVNNFKKIALGHISTPNVILLKQDLSYSLLINHDKYEKGKQNENDELPEELSQKNVRQFINDGRENKLVFLGGDSYYNRLARYIYSYIIMVEDRYSANPVLTTIMLISLVTTSIVLLYRTKTYLQDDGNQDQNDVASQTNHMKRD